MKFKNLKELPLLVAVRTDMSEGWAISHPTAVLAHGNSCLFPKKGGGTGAMTGYMLDVHAGSVQVKLDVTNLLEALAKQCPEAYMTYVTKSMLIKYK